MKPDYEIMILSGGFDPVRKGHVRMFKEAKKLAKTVVVGVNSDEWLTRKKGKPFMKWSERAEIVKAFKYVDEVLDFNDDDDSACDLIYVIDRVFRWTYGRTYYGHHLEARIAFGNGGDRTKENTPEQALCSERRIDLLWGLGGGKVQSSSELLRGV